MVCLRLINLTKELQMSSSLPIAPPIGNKMKNLYDPDVIKTLVAEQNLTVEAVIDEPEKLDPFDNITIKKHTCEEGFVLFSKLFHKPKNIPNIPIRVYKAEDWDEASRNHIPSIDPCWVWNKKALEEFAIAMHCGDTTLLFGLQGTGKSCLAEMNRAEGFLTGLRPLLVISNTPTSLVGPKRFFTVRKIRKV